MPPIPPPPKSSLRAPPGARLPLFALRALPGACPLRPQAPPPRLRGERRRRRCTRPTLLPPFRPRATLVPRHLAKRSAIGSSSCLGWTGRRRGGLAVRGPAGAAGALAPRGFYPFPSILPSEAYGRPLQ
ncbi:hypothetical protein PVAP13_5NG251981 [Panicum virgatum]|uniref:Uncharacterized protein n=1 Tax=Panicum virgatum TaxID=38727 RepID=A0A8T0RVD0_PANVG|nr:hypothetical protein PVAP13_5NG251981 [Panicum virgatum]